MFTIHLARPRAKRAPTREESDHDSEEGPEEGREEDASDRPRPAIAPRPEAMHCLVDKKGQSIAIYDAISVAQLFAQPPEGLDAEVARSVYVYPYGQKGALFRYRVDAAALEKKPTKHKPVAATDAMNEHLINEDSYRPCHTLSSDGRELYVLRYGKAMKRAELMALDPITLEALRPPVQIATPAAPRGAWTRARARRAREAQGRDALDRREDRRCARVDRGRAARERVAYGGRVEPVHRAR